MNETSFEKLLRKMAETYAKKAADYSGDVPRGDLEEVGELGIEPWVGVVIRMIHKFGRLKNLVKTRKITIKEETIRDTLMDIACYALITIILYEDEQNKIL